MAKRNYKIFLALLVLIPLAYGGFAPARATLLVATLIAVLLWRKYAEVRRKEGHFYHVPGLLPLALLAIFMVCQLIPLPPHWVKLISPKTWQLYHETIWVVRPGTWMSLSVLPIKTAQEIFHYFSYVVLYFLTVQALSERERIHTTVNALAVFAGLFSLAGIGLYFFPGSSFVHHSLFGGGGEAWLDWTVAVFPLLLGLFLAFRPRVHYGTLAEKFLQFFKNPSAYSYILHLVLLLIVATALLIGSADVVPAAGLAVFAVMVMLSRSSNRKTGLVLLAIAVLTAGTGLYRERGILHARHDVVDRPIGVMQLDPMSFVRDHVATGSGFGTFENIVPRYYAKRGTEARNPSDLLKLLGEGGAVSVVLSGWFLFSLLRKTLPQWLLRQNRTAVYLYPGALAGLVAVLVNGLINLSTSAEVAAPVSFFFLAGVMVVTANIRSAGKKIDLPALNLNRYSWAPVLTIGSLLLGLVFNGGILLGEHYVSRSFQADAGALSELQNHRRLQQLEKQRFIDPLDPEFPYAAADSCLAAGDYDGAIAFLVRALKLSPLNGKYAQALGLALAHQGEKDKAEKLLQAGLKNDPFAAERHKEFALWLFSKKKTEQGLAQISHALSLSPEKTPTYLAMMNLYGVSEKQMRRVLPDNALSYAAFGNYLLAKGRGKPAEEMFRQAMQYAGKEVPDEDLFWQLYRYYSSRDRIDEALQVLQAGIRVFPKEADFRVLIAGVYEQLGISFRAIEEYRNALLLDPGNRSARERLAALEDR